MTKLKPGWRREPLVNCPICKGEGVITWRLFKDLRPQEWKCIGRNKKGHLQIVETKKSKTQREVWLEYATFYDGSCACVRMKRLDFTQLKRTAVHLNLIRHNKKPPKHGLNDDISDLFPGPYTHPEFLK